MASYVFLASNALVPMYKFHRLRHVVKMGPLFLFNNLSRLRFEKAVRFVADSGSESRHEAQFSGEELGTAVASQPHNCELTATTTGGLYSQSFLRAVEPLYNMHMGVENMGPLLYALVRFTKPRRVLEVGAGYTSVFILQVRHNLDCVAISQYFPLLLIAPLQDFEFNRRTQALKDNADELRNLVKMRRAGKCDAAGTPWTVESYFSKAPPEWMDGGSTETGGGANHSKGKWGATGVLHCVDNMAHAHTTAHKVLKVRFECPFGCKKGWRCSYLGSSHE